MTIDGFTSMREACRHYGLDPQTLRRIVRRGDVAAFRSPLDARVILVRTADLEALRTPRVASRTKETAATTAA
jgi:hypothetical protein